MEGLRSDLAQRRLLGAEAGTTARRKTTVELGERASEATTKMRERALSELSRQMSELTLKGGLIKERARGEARQFRLGALSEIMQLGSMATGLEVRPVWAVFYLL